MAETGLPVPNAWSSTERMSTDQYWCRRWAANGIGWGTRDAAVAGLGAPKARWSARMRPPVRGER